MSVKVRMAPSPTGNLHIGTARTTLFNWLFARKHGGEFILRIEDTDLERSDKKYEEDIVSGLSWLGLAWDGPVYRQTERMATYRAYLEKLLAERKAFWCEHTKEELEAERQDQQTRKQAPRHLCSHKNENRTSGIIRLAVDGSSTRKVTFHDIIRGDIEWEEGLIGDLSLAKNLDAPLFNFSNVVDDITMNITHVIRGEDHISNTPKQVLIYEALGVPVPQFAHLPLILAPDRTKLSKRHGTTSVDDYRKDYLPEALINFMGSLGYTYSKEILTREEMLKEFELEKVHKSGAVFNIDKLDWINAQYVKALSPAQFRQAVGIETIPDAAVPFITQRLERLSHVGDFDFFWKRPDYEPSLLLWKNGSREDTRRALENIRDILQKTIHVEQLSNELDTLAESFGGKGFVYWPLRVALSGRDKSPGPTDIVSVVGLDEARMRIGVAITKLT